MEQSEDLDLDSLMDLLDDDAFEEDLCVTTTAAHSVNKSPSVKGEEKPAKCRRLELRNMFQDNLMVPQKIINPKKDVEEVGAVDELSLKGSLVHAADPFADEEERKLNLTESGKEIKTEIDKILRRSPKHKDTAAFTWKSAPNQSNSLGKADNVFVDSYSGIRIVDPLVSHSMLQQRMDGRKMVKMSFIRNYLKGKEIEGDWVTMGILVVKTPPRTSQHGNSYSIWKLSDLHDPEKTVAVFLFKGAHKDHWKTSVGTVLGLLNPSVMSDNKDTRDQLSLAVDHPGKIMLMGKSKDLGFCKSKRRDGLPCNIAVNVFQCEYCTFHVKKEYKKFSSKRSELQAAFSGREPNLKNRLLKGQNVFYGGQSFTSVPIIKKPNQLKSKDKLTLSNLGLKRKAQALESVEKEKSVKKLTDLYGPNILNVAKNNSEFINNQLVFPCAGSKNLLQHLMKDKLKKPDEKVKIISPKDLIKMRNNHMAAMSVQNKPKSDALTLRNLMPQLGKGLRPGQEFDLNSSVPKGNNMYSAHDYSKLKAIQKIKESGPIKRKNPNSTKVSSDSVEKVKAVLNKSCEEEKKATADVETKEPSLQHSRLGSLDMNSEKVKQILARKSSHGHEVEIAEMEKEAAYFSNLEKKEQMEEKMSSTTEMVCDVVSCKKCKYTAHSAAERCKEGQHPLKCHKAVKRFFVCKDCKHRTFCFTRIPTRLCSRCNGSNFERTSMLKPRKGPMLDSESFKIRGAEIKHLNSLGPESY